MMIDLELIGALLTLALIVVKVVLVYAYVTR